jgi:arylsulfatase B
MAIPYFHILNLFITYFKPEMLPENRGFDSHYGYLIGAEGHYNHSQCIEGACGTDFRDNGKSTNDTFGQYNADLFAARAEKIVGNHDFSKPLYLYTALQNVHYPLEAPERFLKQYRQG